MSELGDGARLSNEFTHTKKKLLKNKNKYLLMTTATVWMIIFLCVYYPVPKRHLNDENWNYYYRMFVCVSLVMWINEPIDFEGKSQYQTKLIEKQLKEISIYICGFTDNNEPLQVFCSLIFDVICRSIWTIDLKTNYCRIQIIVRPKCIRVNGLVEYELSHDVNNTIKFQFTDSRKGSVYENCFSFAETKIDFFYWCATTTVCNYFKNFQQKNVWNSKKNEKKPTTILSYMFKAEKKAIEV